MSNMLWQVIARADIEEVEGNDERQCVYYAIGRRDGEVVAW